MKTAGIDVSICIVNWNTRDLLQNALKSVYEKTKEALIETIIVDNASQDGSVEMLGREFPQCVVIPSTINLGFVKGNNVALKEAKGRYILFLNPDTELKTNAIDGLVHFLESHPDYGAAGCKLLNRDGTIQFSCARTFPTPFNQLCFLAMLDRLFPKSRFFSTVEMKYWNHIESREVDCLSGACILVRKEIVDRLSGFDEAIFMYAEDVDLCCRVKESGWRIYYLAEEEIVHYSGGSSSQQKDRCFSALLQRESNRYFIRKHSGRLRALRFSAVVMVGSLVRLLLLSAALPGRVLGNPAKAYPFYKYLSLFLWSMNLRKVRNVR